MKPLTETPSAVAKLEVQTLYIEHEEFIDAPLRIVWDSLLEELGPGGTMLDGTPFPKKLEAWPGGRWFRDLGNHAGHLWGHVQVIKPPTLLEFCGPMMMSYPAVSHVQYRLIEDASKIRLRLLHTAMGLITPEHREGMTKGWKMMNEKTRQRAEKKK
jgi:hypothetical protein